MEESFDYSNPFAGLGRIWGKAKHRGLLPRRPDRDESRQPGLDYESISDHGGGEKRYKEI
jgi:hypothetical protein